MRPGLLVAYEVGQESWDGADLDLVRVNDFDAEPFRYLRLREPPYSEEALQELAARLRPPAYVYFRHEDAATAPGYARRLLQIVH